MAGELVRRHPSERIDRVLLGGAALAAAVHGVAFFVAARAEAKGSGLLWFVHDVAYEPSAGWVLWIALAALGSAAAAMGLLTGSRRHSA